MQIAQIQVFQARERAADEVVGRAAEQQREAGFPVHGQAVKQVLLQCLVAGDEQLDAVKQGMTDDGQVGVEFQAALC